MNIHRIVVSGLFAIAVLVSLPVQADTICFSASKSYRIHPLRGGADAKDGWSVKGDAFNRCVHQAEVADRLLRGKYPETIYALSLTATIGCHEGC